MNRPETFIALCADVHNSKQSCGVEPTRLKVGAGSESALSIIVAPAHNEPNIDLY